LLDTSIDLLTYVVTYLPAASTRGEILQCDVGRSLSEMSTVSL